jgi:acyl-CoA thioesterase
LHGKTCQLNVHYQGLQSADSAFCANSITLKTDYMNKQNPQALAEACADALWRTDNASRALGMTIEQVGPGTSVVSMIVTESMSNGHGSCHGGFIFSLADSAFAFACNTYNQNAVAQHCSITYISPAQCGDKLNAVAQELSRQGRSGIYDIAIDNQEGVRIAEFRGHSRTINGTLIPDS